MKYNYKYTEPDGSKRYIETDADAIAVIRCPWCRVSYGFAFTNVAQPVDRIQFSIGGRNLGEWVRGIDEKPGKNRCNHCGFEFSPAEAVMEQLS